jgi:hypothetical protein
MKYDFNIQLKNRKPISEKDVQNIKATIIENGDGFTNVDAIIPNETRIVHALVIRPGTYEKLVTIFEENIPSFLVRHEFVELKNPPNNYLPVFRRI